MKRAAQGKSSTILYIIFLKTVRARILNARLLRRQFSYGLFAIVVSVYRKRFYSYMFITIVTNTFLSLPACCTRSKIKMVFFFISNNPRIQVIQLHLFNIHKLKYAVDFFNQIIIANFQHSLVERLVIVSYAIKLKPDARSCVAINVNRRPWYLLGEFDLMHSLVW